MIKKNTKIATWSLVISVATLLILVSGIVVTRYTNIVEKFDFFNTKELKADLKESYERIDILLKEKEVLMNQLSEKLKEFEALKQENDILKSDLEIKNQEIKVLTEKVNSLEKDVASLLSMKKELYASVQKNEKTAARIDQIVAENLKNQSTNEKNTIQKASFVDTSLSTINKNTTNNSPVREIVRNEEDEVRLLNSTVRTFQVKNSGDRKLTTNIDKVNSIQLEYTLFKDKSSNKTSNTFYVQIFDTNNKNIGNTQSVFLDGKELIYSFLSKVENDKAINNIKEEYEIKDLNLFKGIYFLNIFSEKGKLLSTRSFKLE